MKFLTLRQKGEILGGITGIGIVILIGIFSALFVQFYHLDFKNTFGFMLLIGLFPLLLTHYVIKLVKWYFFRKFRKIIYFLLFLKNFDKLLETYLLTLNEEGRIK